jgi:hypothetical protein
MLRISKNKMTGSSPEMPRHKSWQGCHFLQPERRDIQNLLQCLYRRRHKEADKIFCVMTREQAKRARL